jgi:hypothetical protein
LETPATDKSRSIGLYSRPHTLAKLDGRTKEATLMRQVRKELIAHVGGSPNAVQRALIERAVMLSLKVAQIDAKMLAGGPLTVHDSNYALAWNNSLRRTLVALGIESAAQKPPSFLEEMLAEHAAENAA